MVAKNFFDDVERIEDVGGSVSLSLTGRKYNLSEVKRALLVVMGTFLQVYFQSSANKKYESILDGFERFIDDQKIIFGKEMIDEVKSMLVSISSAKDSEFILSGEEKDIINGYLGQIYDLEWDDVPVEKIQSILKSGNVVMLAEDFSEWKGILVGDSNRSSFRLGDINQVIPESMGQQFRSFSNASMELLWEQDPDSGKYNVMCYIR